MLGILKKQAVAVAKETECLGMCRHKSGNFSVYNPETGYVVITPSGMARGVLGPEHAYIMDLSSKVIERTAEIKPSSEVMIHLCIYKERKDIRAVAHTHTRYSTTFSIMNESIMPIVYECAYLGKTGTVPVAPCGRAGAVDLAEKVVEVMEEYDCCFMESHDAIAADEDMDAAFLKVQYVEEIAEVYYVILAARSGAGLHALPVEELQKWTYPREIIL